MGAAKPARMTVQPNARVGLSASRVQESRTWASIMIRIARPRIQSM